MSETIKTLTVYVLPPVTCDCPPVRCEPWCGTCIWSPCPAKRAALARLDELHRELTP